MKKKYIHQLIRGILACLYLTLPSSVHAQKHWKIMSVGNSITAGVGSGNSYGYRDDLSAKLKSVAIDFEFVGPDGAPYNGHFQSGARTEDFWPGGSKDITPSLVAYQPNVILIHVGTNNMTGVVSPYSNNRGVTFEATASGKLATLLNHLRQYNDGTKGSFLERVLVCKIIPKIVNSNRDPNVEIYNSEIERMFFENPPFPNMTIVDMFSIINSTDMADDRHPNDTGFAKMAAEFANLLNGLYRPDTTPPGNLTNLQIQPLDAQTAGLQWKASGDDGLSGRANLYELRFATFALTNQNFSQGKLLSLSRPASAQNLETKNAAKLVAGLSYYFGIRIYDEWNNRSSLAFFPPVNIVGTAGTQYCSDFMDATLPDWSVNSGFEVNIVQQELRLRSGSAPAWDYLATFKGARYNASAKSVRATMRWSRWADYAGINASGVAMMLDKPDYNANGYMIRVREKVIYLYQIINGQVLTKEISKFATAVTYPQPSPGDSLVVKYSPGGVYGYLFDVYMNNVYLGQVYDSAKLQGNGSQLYSGLMLYGGGYFNGIAKFCLDVPPLDADAMNIYAGHSQHGKITRRLAEPLTVQVVDVNGIPVSDVQVGFRVKSGQAQLSTDSLSMNFNGNLWVEAERGILKGPYIEGNTIEASNNTFIYVPYDVDREKGVASYQVYVQKAGNYKVWLRAFAADGSHNSCFISVNGSDTLQVDFSRGFGIWAWVPYNARTFNLPEGFVNFAIKNRESNTRIDKILLTTNSSYTPQGTGESTQRFSNLTDIGGLAYTFLSFGTQSGRVEVEAYAPRVKTGQTLSFEVFGDALDPIAMMYASERVLTDTVGRLMKKPFAVRLQDTYNNNCAGVQVEFAVVEGDGSYGGQSSLRVAANSQGIAEAKLRLGYLPSGSKVMARLLDLPDIPALPFEALPDIEGIPVEIVQLRGNGQQNTVHQPLPDSLVVQVLDRQNHPVLNYPVPFRITRGNGLLNGASVVVIDSTDIQGKAQVQWTLGDTAGVDNNKVIVDVPLNNAPLYFTASAGADAAKLLSIISGDNQQGFAGETFLQPLVVKITDRFGNGRKGYPITFSKIQGAGNGDFAGKDTSIQNSDSLGLARVYYNAGDKEGINQVMAQVPANLGIPIVIFGNLTVQPPKPSRILELSGNNQEGRVAEVLAEPFHVKVTDPFVHPMSNIRVRFKVAEGDGKFAGLDSLIIATNSNGEAQALLQLGTGSGTSNNRVRVTLMDYPTQAVEFFASALPGSAAELTQVSDLQFSEKAEAIVPIQVMVKDAYGNARPGQIVTFSALEGTGAFEDGRLFTEVPSNVKGIASVNYRMGTQSARDNMIIVSSAKPNSEQLKNSPITIVGRVLPGPANQLVKIEEINQAAKILSTLPSPFTVEVRDVYGNSILAGQLVHFQVIAGGGSIGGEQEVGQVTDALGRASVFLRLGNTAGTNNNAVRAYLSDRPAVTPVEFKASALADDPDYLSVIGDSVWTIKVKTELTPTVRVTDTQGNVIKDFPVLFSVKRGGGKLKGLKTGQLQDTVTVATDIDGRAMARWVLGDQPDSNIVHASGRFAGNPLRRSPLPFIGIAKPDDPQSMQQVSAASDTGVVRQPLANPLAVRIVDRNGNAVSGHAVLFEVIYPALSEAQGRLFTQINQADSAAKLTVITNIKGIATVNFKLGPEAGPNYIRASSKFISSNLALFGSPVNFHVQGLASPAKSLLLLGSNTLSGAVGSILPLRIQALDRGGKPVGQHPIQFKVMEQMSYINVPYTRWQTVNTGSDGIALVQWHLGDKTGTAINQIEVSSPPLDNSPLLIKADVTPGPVHLLSSAISATDSVAADNVAKARVTITLTDSLKNPISGLAVQWESSDSGVIFEQVGATTDAKGLATVDVRATQAGLKRISARIPGAQNQTLCCAEIHFLPGLAAKVRIWTNNNQIGNVGTVLRDSLAVQVLDAYNNPVPRVAVTFLVSSGGGIFLEGMATTSQDTSDQAGLASRHLILGKQAEVENVIIARIDNAQVVFKLQAKNAVPAFLDKYEEVFQQVKVGGIAPYPLQIKVEDSSGLPVWNVPILFSALDSGAVIATTNPIATNHLGLAQAKVQLGRKAGERMFTAGIIGTDFQTTFVITALGKEPATIQRISTSPQQTVVGQKLPHPLAVMLKDEFNNGVANAIVRFKLIEGSGAKLSGPDTVRTDLNGVASVEVSLGQKAGDYTFIASTPWLPAQVATFPCSATPEIAYRLEKPARSLSGDEQRMTAGRELLNPIVVVVKDKYGNPVPDVQLQFAPLENSGYMQEPKVASDDSGRVLGRWVLGPLAGTQKLMAFRLGLTSSPIQYTAIAVTNNFPEFFDLPPGPQQIDYNKLFSFSLKARDLDNDPLKYSVKITPNATNAIFDSMGTQVLSWTPTVRQKGDYLFRFSVTDNKGGADMDSLLVKVVGDSAPVITSLYPPCGIPISVTIPDSQVFTISASDYDGDRLSFTWYVDGIPINGTRFVFRSKDYPMGVRRIWAEVSDGQKTTKSCEYKMMVTRVELSLFRAEAQPYKGVFLEWQTGQEIDNQGFDVLRSLTEHGRYERISARLIASRQDGHYVFSDSAAQAGQKLYYKIEDISVNGMRTQHGPVQAEIKVPERFEVFQNYPNPFNPETRIRFQLPASGHAHITVFNAAGQVVRELVDTELKAGYHEILWNGKNTDDKPAASGVYYYRIKAGADQAMRKMVLLR